MHSNLANFTQTLLKLTPSLIFANAKIIDKWVR